MTTTEYNAKVTAIIDRDAGPDFEYPNSFDSDVAACFQKRMSPEDAAAELLKDYAK